MILQRLREETSRNHSAIESHMPLLDPQMSLRTYRQLLARFWGYYAPLEDRLRSEVGIYWPTKEYLCSDRAKVPHLEKDLRVLGKSLDPLECCTNLPELNTPAQVLGCLYVIEGATLGGQIISKHLLANLGLGIDNGAAFFNGYGANSGSQWQFFRSFLTKNAEPINQDDAIVASANETFRTLGEWLFPYAICEPTVPTVAARHDENVKAPHVIGIRSNSSPSPRYSGERGSGGEGQNASTIKDMVAIPPHSAPHPQPFSPEYQGEGSQNLFVVEVPYLKLPNPPRR